MKEVKTQKKYKCDFCKRRSTKSAMGRHEKVCFRNPNRFCENCKNTGTVREHLVGDGVTEPAYYEDYPCVYCSKRDPEIEKGIAKYEKSLQKTETQQPLEVPF